MKQKLAVFYFLGSLSFAGSASEVALNSKVSCTLAPVSSFSKSDNNSQYWQSNFENETLDKWSYLLNPQGISIEAINAAKTEHAAKVTIQGTEDFLWNGLDFLNRSELQYKPSSVKLGQQTQLSWKFMVPELFSEARHEFAYWESDKSYQQIMRFNLEGKHFYFSDSKGQVKVKLNEVSKNKWYLVEMAIDWSPQKTKGKVTICVDGIQYASKTPIASLIDEESVFFQIGILRDRTDIEESIYIDDVEIAVK